MLAPIWHRHAICLPGLNSRGFGTYLAPLFLSSYPKKIRLRHVRHKAREPRPSPSAREGFSMTQGKNVCVIVRHLRHSFEFMIERSIKLVSRRERAPDSKNANSIFISTPPSCRLGFVAFPPL